MSQLFEMCKAIVNYPKNEMTVDDVIDSMNGAGVNPHSIRCALSKIASKSVLVEPTTRHRGRIKIYKKRKDIGDQWDWMLAHKSPTDRLVLPNPETVFQFRKQSNKKTIEKKNTQMPSGNLQTDIVAADRLFNELANIGKALGSIEKAIHENTKALQAIEIGKPTVVVRKEKA